MKRTIILLMSIMLLAYANAADVTPAETNAPASDSELSEVTLETAARIEKSVAQDKRWIRGENGPLIQLIEAPSPLDPIDPFAKAEAGFGERNISKDTVTGRPMGLQLVRFEF